MTQIALSSKRESREASSLDHPCKHGHFDCSDRPGGACDNEKASEMATTETPAPQVVEKLPTRTIDTWPTHSDGRLKKFSELTANDKRRAIKEACDVLQAEFNQPHVQDALAKLLAPKTTVRPSSEATVIWQLLDSTYKEDAAQVLPSMCLLDPNHLPVFCKLHGNIIPLGSATSHAEAERLGAAHGVTCSRITRSQVTNEAGAHHPRLFFLLH